MSLSLARINRRRWLHGLSQGVAMKDTVGAGAARLHAAFPDLAYVGGYISNDPGVNWTQAQWNLWPSTTKKIVYVQFSDVDAGDVLDSETGNTLPTDPSIETWITKRKAAGYLKPNIYCSLDNVPAIRVSTGKWVLGKDYQLVIAHWTGYPAEVPGYTVEEVPVVQYLDAGPWDLDVVFDHNWPYREAPKPPPPPVRYVKLHSPGGKTVEELAAAAGVTVDNLLSASEDKLSKVDRDHFENVIAGHLLRGMPYWVKK